MKQKQLIIELRNLELAIQLVNEAISQNAGPDASTFNTTEDVATYLVSFSRFCKG